MIHMLKKMLKSGVSTRKDPFKAPPRRARGKIEVDGDRCISCEVCVDVCPADAIELTDGQLIFDYAKCMYCGLCVDHCPEDALTQLNTIKESTRNKDTLKESFTDRKSVV